MNDNPTTAERQQYAGHRDEQFWTSSTEQSAPPVYDFKPQGPPATKNGVEASSRRHKFTREECQRGFWAAIDSIIARYPDAVMADGRHISCNFLRGKKWQADQQQAF